MAATLEGAWTEPRDRFARYYFSIWQSRQVWYFGVVDPELAQFRLCNSLSGAGRGLNDELAC